MKKIIVFLLIFVVFFTQCSSAPFKPLESTDFPVKVWLKREELKKHAENIATSRGVDAYFSADGGGEGAILWALGIFIFLPICIGVSHAIPNTNVYIWPDGFENYKQEIFWGENVIYLPGELEQTIVTFHIEIEGKYKGKVKYEKKVEKTDVEVKDQIKMKIRMILFSFLLFIAADVFPQDVDTILLHDSFHVGGMVQMLLVLLTLLSLIGCIWILYGVLKSRKAARKNDPE